MTALEHARAYLARGWSVFPLVPRTKRPAVELRPYLTGERRVREDEVLAFWNEDQPPLGIGIVCGQPSGGLVVVDVDPRNGGDCEAAKRDCPTGYIVETGGGGLHLYTTALHHVPKGKTNRLGVDRQGDGGYVVAPPSVHGDTGRHYRCIGHGELGPTPEWVLARPGNPLPGASEPHAPWLAGVLSDPAGVPPGTQDETLTRLAWWAAGSLDRDIAEAVLWRFTQGLTLGNPSDPWTIEHLRAKLDSAYQKREPEFTVEGVASGPSQADAEATVSAIEAAIRPAPEYVVSNREDWIVEHIAAPGCFTEIIGEVKKGKTTFNAQMIRCILEGRPFLGWKVRPTPVLLYTEQVGLSLEATLERAGVRRHPSLHLLDQSQTFGRPWGQVVCALLRYCQRVQSQLLFIDTTTRLAGVEGEAENAAGVVSILDPFRAAKAMGVAVVFVRHASKSRENREDVSRAGRGSTAITGDMDIVVNLYQPGTEDVRRVKTVSRLGEEITVLLRYDGSGYEVVTDDVPVTRHDRRAADARAEVESEFRAGNTSVAGIAKALSKDPKTVRKYLREITGGLAAGEEGRVDVSD